MADSRHTNADPDLLLNQLADEFAARQRRGERPSLQEYCDRHPELADDIRSLFPAMVELEQAKADAGPDLAVVDADAPTDTALGDFRLLREVGRGGMGVVYEAEQISLGRRVALKLLPSAVFRDPVKKRRFEREAKAAAKLHHTNIVPVHGFGEHDGTPYYVMQFIPGLGLDIVIEELRSLPGNSHVMGPDRPWPSNRSAMSVALARSLIGPKTDATAGWGGPARDALSMTEAGESTPGPVRRGRSTPISVSSSAIHLPGRSGSGARDSGESRPGYWPSVARIGVQVAGALAYAHKQGILHRDIKPANLLLDLEGVVWVTDFGLAKADDSDDLTVTGDLVGTFRYMPPEGFDGKSDARSDVYALGLTLFELVALRPAYEERDRHKLIREITTGATPRLRKLRPDAPRDLVTIVEKACEKELPRRYQTAEALANDLQRFLDGRPISARPVGTLERAIKWVKRNPVVTGAALAVMLVLTAGTTVSYTKYLDAQKQQVLAEAGHRDAQEQRIRANTEAGVARQNLYYAQMHLAPETWRGGHRSLTYLRAVLQSWSPPSSMPDRRGWEWFYLNSLTYQSVRTLVEGVSGTRRPTTVAWHVPSNRLAEGTAEGLIRIWDADHEQTQLTLKGPPPQFQYFGTKWLDWSPTGHRIAAGGSDGTVHIYETSAGRELRVIRGHRSAIKSIAFDSGGARVTAWSQEGSVKTWNADSGDLTHEVVHPGPVTAGGWSPDDKLLATGHGDGTVTVSDAGAGDYFVTLRADFAPITSLAWSPDSARIAGTSSYDYAVRVWDIASAKVVLGPLRHGHEVNSVAWEPNGQRIATCSIDETVKIWDAGSGREEVSLRGNPVAISSISWGPGGRLATGCIEGSVKVWDQIRDQESNTISAHAGRAHSVAWSPNGKRLASGGDDGKLRIGDAATRDVVLSIDAHDPARVNGQFGLIRSFAWRPDGAFLASAGLDGATKVWEAAGGREVFALPADHGAVWTVGWSPDGARLAVGTQDGTIRVVAFGESREDAPGRRTRESSADARTLTSSATVREFKSRQQAVRSLAWNRSGDRLASGGADGSVKVWDPANGTELLNLEGHGYYVMGLAWSPDGNQIASGGGDMLVKVWDAQTGRKLASLSGHHGWIEALVWSPDGTRLASTGTDNAVRIWDSSTSMETLVLRGAFGMFHGVSWHPDGAQVAAASDDGHIWIWDATRGYERDTTERAWPYIERAITSGKARGEDLLGFARTAFQQKRYAAAAQYFADAMAIDPKRFADYPTQHRYDAARAAALAASGQGEVVSQLDDAAKARLRRQALESLRAELTAWRGLAALNLRISPPELPKEPRQWSEDTDLACIRDAAYLAKLPDEEQKSLAQLWSDAAATEGFAASGDTIAVLRAGALHAWFARDKELAALCTRALRSASDTDDATTAERTAKVCCIRPLDGKTVDGARVLAQRAIELGRGDPLTPYFQMALGMAEYRCGNYAAAEEALTTAARLGTNNYIVSGTTSFFQAMTLFGRAKKTKPANWRFKRPAR